MRVYTNKTIFILSFSAMLCFSLQAQKKAKDFNVQLNGIFITHLTTEGADSLNRINSKERRSVHFNRDVSQADFDLACQELDWIRELHIASGNKQISNITAISNLDSLKVLSISYLYASKESPIDLVAIANLTALTDIRFNSTLVTNTDALRSLKRLQKVDFYMSNVASILFLFDTPDLRELTLYGSHHTFENYEPVASLEKLSYLNIYMNKQATDEGLEVLKSLSNLKEINMKNNKEISSLDFLENNRDLEKIDAAGCSSLSDFSALSMFKKLQFISFRGTRLESLDMLEGITTLEGFFVSDTRIKDISFLSNCRNLQKLNISRTSIRDISPLTNCYQINSLKLSRSSDLEFRKVIKQIELNNPGVKIE